MSVIKIGFHGYAIRGDFIHPESGGLNSHGYYDKYLSKIALILCYDDKFYEIVCIVIKL
jgi:hypothetical protein